MTILNDRYLKMYIVTVICYNNFETGHINATLVISTIPKSSI